MTDEEGDLRAELADGLADLSAPERRGAFLGILGGHLPEDGDVVLVGGALVELLTEGAYVTGDVDLVGDPNAIGGILEAAGFDRSGRHFVHEELGLVEERLRRRAEQEGVDDLLDELGDAGPREG